MKKDNRMNRDLLSIEWGNNKIIVCYGNEKYAIKLIEVTGREVMHMLVDLIADKKEGKI